MDVEVTTPQDHVGDVVGDLNRRRGMIQNQDSAVSTISGAGACAAEEMFGYISDLRSMTKGPGFVHDAVPSLRSGAAQHRGRDHGEVSLRRNASAGPPIETGALSGAVFRSNFGLDQRRRRNAPTLAIPMPSSASEAGSGTGEAVARPCWPRSAIRAVALPARLGASAISALVSATGPPL